MLKVVDGFPDAHGVERRTPGSRPQRQARTTPAKREAGPHNAIGLLVGRHSRSSLITREHYGATGLPIDPQETSAADRVAGISRQEFDEVSLFTCHQGITVSCGALGSDISALRAC